jgi:spore coat protein A, manganese oxidase
MNSRANGKPGLQLSRRRFLRLAGAAGAGLALPVRLGGAALAQAPIVDPDSLTMFRDPLPVPGRWPAGRLAARGLRMAPSTHQFHSELPGTPTWGYGGASYLGPTIEARRGVPVSFTAYNDLGPHLLGVDEELHGPDMANDQQQPRVSLHKHGGYTEPESDGYPEDTFVPGEAHVYNYVNDQQAGTIWYHDHALGITRLNVYAGLAGFYLIRDAHEASLGLPPSPFEIPLAIQDKSFNEDGSLFYPDPWEPEFFGNVAVVNGRVWPYLDVGRGWYRLRLLNGSSSRFYNLQLQGPTGVAPMWQIGTDTGLLHRRTLVGTATSPLVLAPGERADILVNFRTAGAGQTFHLVDVGAGSPPLFESPAEDPEFFGPLLELRVQRRAGFAKTPPMILRDAPITSPGTAVRERNLTLVEIIDPDTDEPVMALLNNRPWATDDIERPTVNTVEIWNLINLTEDSHPIHVHLVQFLLKNRQPIDASRYLEDVFGTDELAPADVGTGDRPYPSPDGYITGDASGPLPSEAGWKDTIQAHPSEVTRIVVPFGPAAGIGVPFGQRVTHTGEYVWHCHILDHEDNEMMLPYVVEPA